MVGNSKPHPATSSVAAGTDGSVSGVGHLLRQARQRAMLDLPLVAEALRIREGYIEAIEEGRFRDLPGPTYAAGFIRSTPISSTSTATRWSAGSRRKWRPCRSRPTWFSPPRCRKGASPAGRFC